MAYTRWLDRFAAPMIFLVLVACAGTKPYQASVDMHLLRPRVPPSVPEGNAVAIVAFPVVSENLGDYGDIARNADSSSEGRPATPGYAMSSCASLARNGADLFPPPGYFSNAAMICGD